MPGTAFLDLHRRVPCQRPVIAFTEPSIANNRASAIAKGDLSGTRGALEVRAEDRRQVIVATTNAELTCLFFTGC